MYRSKMRLMGSPSLRMVAALVMVLLQLSSAYAMFDGFDGRPRPDGMLDAPTKTYGAKPTATYLGQPASCIWYGWESFNYDPKDTKDCSKVLWERVKKLPPENLQAFLYFTLETFPQNMYCTIGCFDLSATSPPPIATPPVESPKSAATPPPPVNAQPDPPPPSPPLPPIATPPVESPKSAATPPPPVNAQPDLPPSPPLPPIATPPVESPKSAATPPPPVNAQLDPPPSPPLPPIASPDPSTTSSPPDVASAPGPASSRPPSQIGLIACICSAGVGAMLVGLLLFCCFKHRRKLSEQAPHHSTSGLCTDMLSRPYTFKELSAITNNFGDSELLSSGAFGDVFKGTQLSPGGTRQMVAVKRIRHHKEHGQASFVAEANSLSQIRHRNLLQLRGWCDAKEGMFLVYDFMSNGSLDTWLHTNPCSNPGCDGQGPTLPWHVRRSVLAGVAEGLEYLHEGWVQCVLHRDIKSSNVLLDEGFNAYLGDFGLARLVDHHTMQKTTVVAGTLGYMAPEMFHTGRATKESDVYSFGVLVLEVVSGRSPLDVAMQSVEVPEDHVLVDRVWRAHEGGSISKMIDPRLVASTHSHGAESSLMMSNVLQLGLLCCLPNPSDRPSIRLVSHWFQSLEVGAIEFPLLPAIQPAPPARYFSGPSLSSTSSSHSSLESSPSSVQTSSPAMTVSVGR